MQFFKGGTLLYPRVAGTPKPKKCLIPMSLPNRVFLARHYTHFGGAILLNLVINDCRGSVLRCETYIPGAGGGTAASNSFALNGCNSVSCTFIAAAPPPAPRHKSGGASFLTLPKPFTVPAAT